MQAPSDGLLFKANVTTTTLLNIKVFYKSKNCVRNGRSLSIFVLFSGLSRVFLRVSSLRLFDLKVSMNLPFGGLPSISPRFHVVNR